MSQWSRTGLLIASLVVASALGWEMAAAAAMPTRGVSPSTWTATVCSDFAHWDAQLLKGSSSGPVSDSNTAKTAITKLLATLEKDTSTLTHDLTKAGTPAIPNGKQVAQTFLAIATRLHDGFAAANANAAALPTNDPGQFLAAAQTIQAQLTGIAHTLIDSLGQATSHVGSTALDKAFRTTKSCGRFVHL